MIAQFKLSTFQQQGLLLLALVIMPLVSYLAPWCLALLALIMVLQYKITQGRVQNKANTEAVAKTILLGFVVVVVAACQSHFGTLLGRDPGVHMLVIVYALKLLESQSRRDFMVFAILSYVLLITYFLFSQALLLLIYSLFIYIYINYFLICFQDNYNNPLAGRKSLRAAVLLVLQSLPLAILLFVFFPRTLNPLWSLPTPVKPEVMGLQNEMTPGDLSKMTQSGEVVFRARFTEKAPEKEQLYWRARVFDVYDSGTWLPSNSYQNPGIQIHYAGTPVKYKILLEPHLQDWIPLLDMPLPGEQTLRSELIIKKRESIKKRSQFHLQSVLNYVYDKKLPSRAKKLYLYLPDDENPKTEQLAQRFVRQYPTKMARLNAIAAYFKERPFEYTLNPPAVGQHGIDDFIFDTQSGYCEHYASALTYLLRMSQIPARVVIGYAGGEYNDLDDYYLIHDYDAHSWVEAWIDDKGWVRVDPTAWVAPERVRMNMRDFLRQMQQSQSRDSNQEVTISSDITESSATGNRVRMLFDAINHRWYEWVIDYNRTKQENALKKLGLEEVSRKQLGFLSVFILIVVLSALSYFLLRKHRQKPPEPIQLLYFKFCAHMKKFDLKKQPHQGPSDFMRLIDASDFPRKSQARQILQSYQILYYGRARISKKAIQRLRKKISVFIKNSSEHDIK